jgi:hypothetical protein
MSNAYIISTLFNPIPCGEPFQMLVVSFSSICKNEE